MTITKDTPLFVYGTLFVAEIRAALFGRLPPSEPAVLRGYTVIRARGSCHPTIRRAIDDNCEILGLLIFDLSYRERSILHAFISHSFHVVELRIEPLIDNSGLSSWCYVLRPELQEDVLSAGIWDLEAWIRSDAYASMVTACQECLKTWKEYR